MIVSGQTDAAMAARVRKALSQTSPSEPPALATRVASILIGTKDGVQGDAPEAVLELKTGLSTELGRRYVAQLRNQSNDFEQPLFSVFIRDDGRGPFAFQSGGALEKDLDQASLLRKAEEFLVRPTTLELIVGLVGQFRRP